MELSDQTHKEARASSQGFHPQCRVPGRPAAGQGCVRAPRVRPHPGTRVRLTGVDVLQGGGRGGQGTLASPSPSSPVFPRLVPVSQAPYLSLRWPISLPEPLRWWFHHFFFFSVTAHYKRKTQRVVFCNHSPFPDIAGPLNSERPTS